jgi:Ca2+-binding EF-hand superfamily protein
MVMMRMERADLLERAKEAQTEQRRHMSRSASLSQHAMSNSLRKIQNNLSNPDLTLALPANVRRNLEKPELRSLFERCDPQGKGTVSVKSVRNLLAEARASMSSSPPGVSQPNKVANVSQRRLLFSYSAGKLLAPATDDSNDERLNMLLQAFNAVDAEGTGSIAKADLYAVLDKAGMTQPGPNAMSSSAFLHTFEGFSNENARMSFDEFVPFASALAKRECAH